METWIYLIRHGSTVANDARPYVLQGSGVDHPLNEAGREQARRAAAFLSSEAFDAVYSSQLARAQETAVAIAQPHGLEVNTVENIHEVDVGDWEGQDWHTIMDSDAAAYAAFMENPWLNPYPGGECYLDVLRRAKPTLLKLAESNVGRRIIVVAHQVVNRALLADFMSVTPERARGIRQKNTGINVIRWRPDEIEVVTVNACFHLAGL